MRSLMLYFQRLFGRVSGRFPLKHIQKSAEIPSKPLRRRHCLIIAGPNGSGKSTITMLFRGKPTRT